MTCLDPQGCGGFHPLCKSCDPAPRIRMWIARGLLAGEGVGAFALWAHGDLPWGLAMLFGLPMLLGFWLTFPAPSAAPPPVRPVFVPERPPVGLPQARYSHWLAERKRNAPPPPPPESPLGYYCPCGCVTGDWRRCCNCGAKR